jgi:hypothetical protein
MQDVDAPFLSAVKAPVRRIAQQVVINFVDNAVLGDLLSVSGDSYDSMLAAERAIDGWDEVVHEMAFADPYEDSRARVFPANNLYPLTNEAGWWGNSLANDSGEISGGETLTLEYAVPTSVKTIQWFADARLGHPVNFVIDYHDGVGWTTLATVTNYSSATYTLELPTAVNVEQLRITISKVKHGQSYAKLLEFQGGLVLDVTNRVISWEITKEREADGSQPYGNSSANQISLELDNADGLFYRNNPEPYAAYMRANRKITVRCGVYVAGSPVLLPQGTFYTRGWKAAQNNATCRVTGWDRAKRLGEVDYGTSQVLLNQRISDMVEMLGSTYGLDPREMQIDETSGVIPYGWFDRKSYWSHLKDLAIGAGGQVYFDEFNRLVFESAEALASRITPVETITDLDTIISAAEGWEQDKMRNSVIVPVEPLAPEAEQNICSLNEEIVVPGSGTKRVTLFFSNTPCIDVQTPEISGGAHISIDSWSAYVWGGELVLENSDGADETVTAITVDGKPLTGAGGLVAESTDAISVRENGERVYELPSGARRFVQSLVFGQALAAGMLDALVDPGGVITVSGRGRPELQLADRVSVENPGLGIDGDFWITRIRLTYKGGLDAEYTLLEVPDAE